jgi:hypothetical protein
MVDRNWPLKDKLQRGHPHVTRGEFVEWLTEFGGSNDDPVWIDNYWQIRHQITQRPIEHFSLGADGLHIS